MMNSQTAIIIGAGPAGLTAAVELLQRTGIRPVVLEQSDHIGGLSRTVNYRGNRIDIGGHRFFSKSDRVMNWWLRRMPMQAIGGDAHACGLRLNERTAASGGPDPDQVDRVMLLRTRRSRIYYQRQFFDYPIRLSLDTLRKLGLVRVGKIGLSYARSMLFPIRDETSLEDFFINRFGQQLYRTFFESYTEKVWGRPCSEISAQWGAQRIKGLSISKALWHALKRPFTPRNVGQKGTETSLIEQFLYPKYGPGQMWQHVAREVEQAGGQVLTNMEVRCVEMDGNRVTAVEAVDRRTGQAQVYGADYFFSSMPLKQLVRSFSVGPPDSIRRINEGLVYRDFITVGLLLEELEVSEHTAQGPAPIRDNWIYIQEPDVRVGRMQVFNNWSPYMVADRSKVWIGLEYFANEHDELWVRPDRELIALATEEMAKIRIIDPRAVLDGTVIRMPKAYPAYFGSYDRFDELRAWIDRFDNLYLIGRNGMHRYNNMDHSMLAAMVAVDNILEGRVDKSNVWAVNAEQEYHEVRKGESVRQLRSPVEPAPAPIDAAQPDHAPSPPSSEHEDEVTAAGEKLSLP